MTRPLAERGRRRHCDVDSTVLTARLADHAWLEVIRPQAVQREIATAFADASPPIRVRIGVHTGDALHEANHFFGTTVNYAARVASHACGGEVLVSQLVHALVAGSGIDFLDSREVELKGLASSHQIYAVDLHAAV